MEWLLQTVEIPVWLLLVLGILSTFVFIAGMGELGATLGGAVARYCARNKLR